MRLARAAGYFDRIDAYDAYSGRKLFKCQLGAFETSNPEGSIAKRRVFSVAPGTPLPARRCVTILGETWMIGEGSQDGLFGDSLRQSYWLRKQTDSLYIRTPAQAVLGTGGTLAFGQEEYLKDTVNGVTDSESYPQYEVSFSKTETLERGYFLSGGTRLYRVRSVFETLAGFKVVAADDVGEAEYNATWTTGAYDPVTDTYAAVSNTYRALVFEPSKLYRFLTQTDSTYLAGDKTMLVAKASLTPTVGQQVTVAGADWRVEQVTSEQDAWNVHLRKR